jgi:glucokinase
MKRYIAGVDVGGTHTKVAILDLRGRIVAKDSFLTRRYKKEALIAAVSEVLDGLISKNRISKKDIAGLGIGVPGLVDFKKGLVFYFVNIPGWKNVALKRKLEKATGLKVFVDNDVKVMALAEMTYGAGRGYDDAICLTLGTGVGGAVIIGGRLYRGASLVAGEIGHIQINEKGPLCNCGNSGCLEAYVGREYFLKDVRKAMKTPKKDITPESLEQAAARGDSFAKKKWEEMGRHIGNALVGVVNLLNPQVIIIGGGMAEAGRFIFGPVRRTIEKRAMKVQKKAVKIVKAKLGNDAGVIGAAELVKKP